MLPLMNERAGVRIEFLSHAIQSGSLCARRMPDARLANLSHESLHEFSSSMPRSCWVLAVAVRSAQGGRSGAAIRLALGVTVCALPVPARSKGLTMTARVLGHGVATGM